MTPPLDSVIRILASGMPQVMRWAGSLARELRKHNIALDGKSSGSALTDALTLADLSVQDLLVGAIRDLDPVLWQCRLEAEESTGDLTRFNDDAELIIALDPIDGTKQFRDHTGNGYAVMLHVRNATDVFYSLVFLPEMGPHGSWVEVNGSVVRTGDDDPTQQARAVLDAMIPMDSNTRAKEKKIYLIGFQKDDLAKAQEVSGLGNNIVGVAPDDMPGSIYPLFASGEFGGSLIHTPNIYDYPVALHIARALGGDSVWAHNGEPVHFQETWMDDRASMLRIPGIAATSVDDEIRDAFCKLAKDWNPVRYRDDN